MDPDFPLAPPIESTLAFNLRVIRLARRLRQVDLARLCTPPSRVQRISEIESGMTPRSYAEIRQLADALGVTVNRLLRPKPRLKRLRAVRREGVA
jgi:transcriptional regulator with XRE-family HTH domain